MARGDDPSGLERGNLFLVGDYKQSIYRFRHADPLLFRSKLDMAEPAVAEARGAGGFQRVDLRENFRSRPDLLRCVNGFFERLMDRAIGEVDRQNLAKYLTIAKLKLENTIALIRRG